MGFQFDFSFFVYEIGVGIRYVPVVLLLSIVPLIAGLFFGMGMAIARTALQSVDAGHTKPPMRWE